MKRLFDRFFRLFRNKDFSIIVEDGEGPIVIDGDKWNADQRRIDERNKQ